MTGPARLRVVLAEDDVLLREGLGSLLERSGLQVVGQAGDAARCSTLVRETEPDLVVVDIRMPPTHTVEGLDAARVIRAELPQTAILVLSAHVEVEHAMELLASGRRHRLPAQEPGHRRGRVRRHRCTASPRAARSSTPRWCRSWSTARRRDDPLAALSDREREVLALMAEGRSNAGIARRLWVTEGTVEKHVRSILAKLDLPDTDEDHRRVLAVLTFLEAR